MPRDNHAFIGLHDHSGVETSGKRTGDPKPADDGAHPNYGTRPGNAASLGKRAAAVDNPVLRRRLRKGRKQGRVNAKGNRGREGKHFAMDGHESTEHTNFAYRQ